MVAGIDEVVDRIDDLAEVADDFHDQIQSGLGQTFLFLIAQGAEDGAFQFAAAGVEHQFALIQGAGYLVQRSVI